MDKEERHRQHLANLERINLVQLVIGRGDRMRIDHEGTLFDRARLLEEEIASHQATERGLAAFDRLLRIAEDRQSAQRRDVADFLAAVWSNKPLPLATLRGHDGAIGDDMLAVLDAFRHARLHLAEHVEGGPRRVSRALRTWSLAGA